MLHLLWFYHIQQDISISKQCFWLQDLVPGYCISRQSQLLPMTGREHGLHLHIAVLFIPWSQGCLLFLLQILAIVKLIDWCTRTEFPCCKYPPLFSNVHGFSQFISRPFKFCTCVSVLVYLACNRGTRNHTIYFRSLVLAVWHKECLVLTISLRQHYKALSTFLHIFCCVLALFKGRRKWEGKA